MILEAHQLNPNSRLAVEGLALLGHPLVEKAIEISYGYLSDKPRKQPFFEQKSLFDHSIEVGSIVATLFPEDPEVISTAILHDVIEDVDEEDIYNVLEDEFGSRVAEGVAKLSEDKRRGFPGKRNAYVSEIADPVRVEDELVAISLVDKYVNVRDMNLVYRELLKATGDTHLAAALHYGAFYSAPHESQRFYTNHIAAIHNRLGNLEQFTPLIDTYSQELEEWHRIFTPPNNYEDGIDSDTSAKLRRECWNTCRSLNHVLKDQDLPFAVAIAGSVAYGAGVRTDASGNSYLHDINLVLHDPETLLPVSSSLASAQQILAQDLFVSTYEDLTQQIRSFCARHNIHIASEPGLIRTHGAFYVES